MGHFYGAIFVIFGACEGEYSIRKFYFWQNSTTLEKEDPYRSEVPQLLSYV